MCVDKSFGTRFHDFGTSVMNEKLINISFSYGVI